MSVQVNTYVILGVKLSCDWNKPDNFDELSLERQEELECLYEDFYDDAFKGIHHHRGLCMLDDGMNGKYTIIGRVYAKTDEGEYFDKPFSIEVTKDQIELVSSLIISNFGIQNPDVKLWIVSHYR